jgi:predicted nucleotidyltransferase
MSVRIGFTQFRKQMLEKEMENIMSLLPQLGVEKVYLTGDMVTGDISPDSRIDLIAVHDTDGAFGRRADFFSYHLSSMVAVDCQVYTPSEFEELQHSLPALVTAIKHGRVIYSAE